VESSAEERRLFRTYPWGRPQLARCGLAGENAEGVKDPPGKSPKKRPARKPQTEEEASPSRQYNYATMNNPMPAYGRNEIRSLRFEG
jgi:hypothetical protein